MAKVHGFLDVPEKVYYDDKVWVVEEILVRNYYPFMLLKYEIEFDPEFDEPGRNYVELKLIDPFNDYWYPETPENKEVREKIWECERVARNTCSALNRKLKHSKEECLDDDI